MFITPTAIHDNFQVTAGILTAIAAESLILALLSAEQRVANNYHKLVT